MSVHCPQPAISLVTLCNPERHGSSDCEQQRPVLRHRSALPHASLRHYLHRCVQVEDEQAAGFPHVPAVLCVSGSQRNAGGQGHQLPSLHLIPLSHPLLFVFQEQALFYCSEGTPGHTNYNTEAELWYGIYISTEV